MSPEAKRSRSPSISAEEEERKMYANDAQGLQVLDEQWPNRPHNHSPTLPFSDLINSLFSPLTKPIPTGAAAKARRAANKVSPTEHRHNIIERFFSRWRNEVGDDIYPAMRLIIPFQDRERGVFRLKEQTIARLLIKLMKISPTSEDGHSLLNWKIPGKSASSRLAGDFAGRCFEALDKRPLRTEPGDMRIGAVNELLDKLAATSGEAEQLPIFEEFYRRMNPQELQWLIRIVLKQMKIGATEKTFLNLWHADGDALFNVSSSLRHVCWELWKPDICLTEEKKGLNLMQCFQPQLASFGMTTTFEKMVEKLQLPENDPYFFIEEKLDGERMQLHMERDSDAPGGFRFGWWSRKGKNYTHLYGDSFEDESSSLTRYLKEAFHDKVGNCILDGEMIAWDPGMNKTLAFGTLKTAALSVQKNPFDKDGWRPMYRVFDCLYLNDQDLTRHPLHVRRQMLEGGTKREPGKPDKTIQGIIKHPVDGRFEIHPTKRTSSPSDIEPMLREIIANSSEGLVIKNPHSPYVLNERPASWIKVKPEYMSEYGENLDCVIIGGYYGSGRRSNMKASFLCGLRAPVADIDAGLAGQETFYSFFKVGGGLTAQDYAAIEHQIGNEWQSWNAKAASKYIVLAGGEKYLERPDVWIRPSRSIVIEVKAASADPTTSFMVGQTLRFPRYVRTRHDKTWDNGALDLDRWHTLQSQAEEEVKTKKEMEFHNRRRTQKRQKRELTVAGEHEYVPVVDIKSKLFNGMTFFVPAGSAHPKKTKSELENLIREHGGAYVQQPNRVLEGDVVPLADRPDAPRVRSIMKFDGVTIIKPRWLFDCIRSEYLLPYEPDHLFQATDDLHALAAQCIDQYGDSYCRAVDVEELRAIFRDMQSAGHAAVSFDVNAFYDQLEARGHELPRSRGHVFRGCHVYLAAPAAGPTAVSELTLARLRTTIGFGNGSVAADLDDGDVTHVVVVVGRGGDASSERAAAAEVRLRISAQEKLRIPRVVTERWVESCWKEETRVSEEKYAPA